ncbi:MAG: hypothetical protein KG028_13740 [Actinobacteria bacterium]|jgi:hypothetical protein|nr:hypothetical protein [Actinomycetota bacterium]
MHPRRIIPFVTGLALLTACTAGTPATPTADGSEQEVAALDDGEYFGFVTAVDAAAGTIAFDPATWVSDDGEPNGYRIDNDEVDAEVLTIGPDTQIEVLLQAGDPGTAASLDTDGLEAWFHDPDSGQDVAFDVTVAEGEATTLRFRYRP